MVGNRRTEICEPPFIHPRNELIVYLRLLSGLRPKSRSRIPLLLRVKFDFTFHIIPELDRSCAMSTSHKHVVWDIVGTVMSYDSIFEAIETRLGAKLREQGIDSRLVGFAWNEIAEREYTYLSISGKYIPFYVVFKGLFYRILAMMGVENPREFATEEDLEYLLQQSRELKARPGAKECWSKLRAAGYTMWAFTAGDASSVKAQLKDNGIHLPVENFITCDAYEVAKPSADAYKPLLAKFDSDKVWFAAAHMWDVSAAKRAG